jgi:hypothetical protein
MKCFKFEVDRGVSNLLCISDFVNLRLVCQTHYNDSEAWEIKAISFPMNINTLTSKEKIALHYLLTISSQFTEPIGSLQWYNNIVTWLQHNVSIKIMSSFLFHQSITNFDLSHLCLRRRFVWQRQFHCKNILLKNRIRKRKREVDEYKLEDEYSSKKRLWGNSFLDYPDFEHIETY